MANWLTRMLRLEGKVSKAGSTIVSTRVGQPMWTPRDYENFADEAYLRNAVAYRCISMIAQSAALVELDLFAGDQETEDHKLLELINRPSPGMTYSEFMERIITFLKIAGNSYVEMVGPERANAAPMELYSLRPDRMKVVAGQNAVPEAYEYTANGQTTRWVVNPLDGSSPIIHMKTFHPLSDWYGMSPVEPAAYSIDRHNEASKHNMAVLQNGAVPSGALIFKPINIDGRTESAPQEILEKAEKRLTERYAGSSNSGRPMVLNGNVEWQQFAQTLEQLQLTESKLDAARDVCNSFGVPHILLVPGQSTYNNNREAKLALYEETVLPCLDFVVSQLNVSLAPRFGEGLVLKPDLDGIDALSIRREEKRKTYIELYEKRLVSRTEVREALGYEPLADLPEYEPIQTEVVAITSLINSNKLSTKTGLEELKRRGILSPTVDVDAEIEALDAQSASGIDGMLGATDVDLLTGKPKAPSILPASKPKLVS